MIRNNGYNDFFDVCEALVTSPPKTRASFADSERNSLYMESDLSLLESSWWGLSGVPTDAPPESDGIFKDG